MISNLQAWLYDFNTNRKNKCNENGSIEGERLGQAFVDDFIKVEWDELYYCEDYEKSLALIVDCLLECRLYPKMPNKIIR